ncbi:MAG: glycosyltransferase family 9 protein [Cyanobacteria bacterium HKST-UBA04]|nr:glycosyltransferase family 9 protein [Cyanobacteria bacterium HKST-UBA04]
MPAPMVSTFSTPSDLSPPSKLLVIPLRFIGDGVLTIPMIAALRAHLPQARIDLFGPATLANLFEPSPLLDGVYTEPGPKAEAKAALADLLSSQRYDTVILARRSVSQALALKRAGVPRRIGFDEQRFGWPLGYKRWGWGLTDSIRFPELTTTVPQAKTYASLLAPLSVPADTIERHMHLQAWTTQQDEAAAQTLLAKFGLSPDDRLAIIHATSASKEKSIPLERFVASVQRLHEAGFCCMALGTAQDAETYDRLQQAAMVPIANLCGQSTLRQSLAIMRHATLFLGLDSGPVHLCAAVGVPHIIALYGPINEQQWRPYPYNGHFTPVFNTALDCRPCAPKVCRHNRCRMDLSSQAILSAVDTHLKQLAPSPGHRGASEPVTGIAQGMGGREGESIPGSHRDA